MHYLSEALILLLNNNHDGSLGFAHRIITLFCSVSLDNPHIYKLNHITDTASFLLSVCPMKRPMKWFHSHHQLLSLCYHWTSFSIFWINLHLSLSFSHHCTLLEFIFSLFISFTLLKLNFPASTSPLWFAYETLFSVSSILQVTLLQDFHQDCSKTNFADKILL